MREYFSKSNFAATVLADENPQDLFSFVLQGFNNWMSAAAKFVYFESSVRNPRASFDRS